MTATIRYMGNKRSLAPAIASLITKNHPNAVLADAFAGTCAVASAVAPNHVVIANDVHEFARIVARALLTGPARPPSVAAAVRDLATPYRRNQAALERAVGVRIRKESAALARMASGGSPDEFLAFTSDELAAGAPIELDGLRPAIEYQMAPDQEPFALFSLLYASTYFGVRQAAEIDSLRYAISQAPEERRDVYLFALLHAASHCAAAPGHFAQFLVPRDWKNIKYIARMRRQSVFQRFLAAIASLDLPKCLNRAANQVFHLEATAFVARLPEVAEHPFVIYADPPYSRAQYSRYYHILETLVLYDYPSISAKARYREGRFNTAFSRTAGVADAMRQFVAAAAKTGAPLYLSYPKNGLLYKAGAEPLEILLEYYPLASLAATTPLAHSTLGGAPGTAYTHVLEDLYYARWE